jgi:hypothetical protein
VTSRPKVLLNRQPTGLLSSDSSALSSDSSARPCRGQWAQDSEPSGCHLPVGQPGAAARCGASRRGRARLWLSPLSAFVYSLVSLSRCRHVDTCTRRDFSESLVCRSFRPLDFDDSSDDSPMLRLFMMD